MTVAAGPQVNMVLEESKSPPRVEFRPTMVELDAVVKQVACVRACVRCCCWIVEVIFVVVVLGRGAARD